MTRRRLVVCGLVAVVLLVGMEITRVARHGQVSEADADIPIARVKRGELDLKVYTTGELRAEHSVMLAAPPIAGGSLQITRLLHTGAAVKKGDVVIEFDPSEQRYKLEQSRSELLQAEQDIIKAKADAAVQSAQDKVALLKAQFGVRRAELEVQKDELVSAIDVKKNQLALDQARRALAELEQDITSHGTTGQANFDLAHEKWNKAKLAMDSARQNIEKMRVVSPIDGMVAIQKNMGSTGGIFFSGASLPDYHEGDQAQPGSAIVQVIVSSEMELSAKVNELERANISQGQSTEIEFDALPGILFHGTVKSAGSMVQRQFWQIDSGSKFNISVQLTDVDTRLRPGLTADIVIIGDKKANTLYIPRQALFQKDGKQTVYLKKIGDFEQRQVKVGTENESRVAIEGLPEGAEVALVDPTAPRSTTSRASQSDGGRTP